jgi:hypothetical protein
MLSSRFRWAGRVVTLAAAFITLGNFANLLASPSGQAYAAGPGAPLQLPAPRVLALPSSTFPHGSHIRNGAQSNAAADATTMLHTTSLAGLGRLEGYHQTVQWTAGQTKRPWHPLTLHYSASIFPSPAAADAAYSDARASSGSSVTPSRCQGTWGWPLRYRSTVVPPCIWWRVPDQSNWKWISPTVHRSTPVDPGGPRTTGTHRHDSDPSGSPTGDMAGNSSTQHGRWCTAHLRCPSGHGAGGEEPSLMTLDQAPASLGATMGVGAFRTSNPRLSTLAEPYAAIAPSTGLSRYAQLESMDRFKELYGTTSLFRTAHAAAISFALQTQTNQSHAWLHPVAMQSYAGPGGSLTRADRARTWGSARRAFSSCSARMS